MLFLPVPFDDNYISLISEEFGSSETAYMNASPIVFEGCPQRFIATQAPKENSFKRFWQMVIQEKVLLVKP